MITATHASPTFRLPQDTASVSSRGQAVSTSLKALFSHLKFHVETAVLFTWTDYKTILLPVIVFACATAPLMSFSRFVQGCAWIWLHLLLCNVSNQARSADEDRINRPWRPVAAGRLTELQAVRLRWVLVVTCILWSSLHGPDLVLTTLGLSFTTFLYDEMGLAGHVIGKNLCNIGGYTTFEIGATKIMGPTRDLDFVASVAVAISGALIFTTIQAQDFPDVKGDAASGRITFPIYAPEFSRFFTVVAIIGWSTFLSWFWHIGIATNFGFVLFGTYVGMRYYRWRFESEDKLTYLIFNGWLMLAHCLPLHARTGALAF